MFFVIFYRKISSSSAEAIHNLFHSVSSLISGNTHSKTTVDNKGDGMFLDPGGIKR